jgi:hypothetical protein
MTISFLVRAVESLSGFVLGLLGVLGLLLGLVWLPVGLAVAGVLVVLAGRVWGRRRLAGAGGWWEVRFGERVSRPALEAVMRTWRVGCRGGFCVPRRGSRSRCPPMRTGRRVACSSRAGSPRRRCARRSSRPSAVSPSRLSAGFSRTQAAVCTSGLRVSRRSARGFCRCASITAWTLPGSCWRRCGRRRPGRAVSFSSCCRPRDGRWARERAARPRGCAQAAGFSRARR